MVIPRLRRLAPLAAFVVAAGPLAAGPALAAPRAVIELYTSQACGFCPPADALLAHYADRDDVVALGFHITYWDFHDWTDTLARTANDRRQIAYSQVFGVGPVFTPQVIINGVREAIGSESLTIRNTIDELAAAGQTPDLPVEIALGTDQIEVSVAGASGNPEPAKVFIVYFIHEVVASIEDGQNIGLTIPYSNVVRSMQEIGTWTGEAAEFQLPIAQMDRYRADGAAILVQREDADGNPGAILGAAVAMRDDA